MIWEQWEVDMLELLSGYDQLFEGDKFLESDMKPLPLQLTWKLVQITDTHPRNTALPHEPSHDSQFGLCSRTYLLSWKRSTLPYWTPGSLKQKEES